MTPIRLVEIMDRKTGKCTWVKIEGSGPLPPLVNPEHPCISQDTGPENPEEDKKKKPS